MLGMLLLLLVLPLGAWAQAGHVMLNGNLNLNSIFVMNYPPPPCSQAIGDVFSHSTSSGDNVGATVWYAWPVITTNGLAGNISTCFSATVATNGPTTATYQWAIYNDAAVSGKPGTVNGALGPSYNATALSGSLTTNSYTLSMTAAFSPSAQTNWVVIKITGSSGNNDLKIGTWNPGSGLNSFSSPDGVTWSSFNTFDQLIYKFWK